MKTEKVDISLSRFHRIFPPRPVVMLGCTDKAGKGNVITLGMSMPVSVRPPLVAVGIAPERYPHELIEQTKEFTLNVPTMEIVKETLYCGRVSGKNRNKIKEVGLTQLQAKKVKAPIIKECITHLECKLNQQVTVGDHTIFVDKVVAAYVNEEAFTEKYDIKKVKPIYYGDRVRGVRSPADSIP